MARQKTIRETVRIEGVGLQTGNKTAVLFKSAPPDSGINFIRVDLPNKPLLNIQSFALRDKDAPERRTTLGAGPLQVQTVEHLLSALSALSISNIVIETDGIELPGLDGSARGYFDILKKGGMLEQDAPQKILKPAKPVWCEGANGSFLAAFPSDLFRISYTLHYDCPGIGTQFLDVVLDEKTFDSAIASARTFCLEEEAAMLIKRGLGKGANYENTLVMNGSGPVKNVLRFPDEPVRHKVLDLVGDLYLVGMPVTAHIVAVKSGHTLNMELVRKLKDTASV